MAFLPSSLIWRRTLSRIWCGSVAHTHQLSKPVPWKIQNLSSPCPCLMLPPSLDNDTSSFSYNFYSLAEKRVLSRPQTKAGFIHDLTFCGSSHGWIALFNSHTLDVFIYNPISLRHINLPSIRNLPSAPDSRRSVKKLILSCSPDEQSCRAVITYNCQDEAAFCCPGHSNEWTPIGITYLKKCKRLGGIYLDFVYSSRQNLFFAFNDYNSNLETWDLTDPSSPRFIKAIKTDEYFDNNNLLAVQRRVKYLVVADDVLLVTRYVIAEVFPDGSYGSYSDLDNPHMTIGFDIAVYDQEEDELHTGLLSLGDFTLFIGSCSDSVALSATLFPELKSNSIYFTDEYMETRKHYGSIELSGGHDIGIFHFENQTVSPCYYPCDRPNLKRIEPSPIWFFPRLP